MSESNENAITSSLETSPTRIEFSCLGSNYSISERVVEMKTIESSSLQRPWTISEIHWDQLPKFKKKQKLEYGMLLDDYCEWVKELEKTCSLDFKIAISDWDYCVKKLENQFLQLEMKTRQFFSNLSIYRGGDIEKQFYQLLEVVQKLCKITTLFMEERMSGDLLVSKVNQSMMQGQPLQSSKNSEKELSLPTHVQLIEQILEEHVARVMSRIDQFEQVKKFEFDSNVTLLQRVEKYSL
ncbi:hypothetical protein C9374_006282 [Naegleria lovaniensis]|uniref:Uncharacterized protein n=1 Tax=Naegleria lovaniensis TaxID=51637 RepID=A0AA88GMG4_NAELO|nr:uncharacterized protein C9374_006282 [Naegleria lovaniensis]KAG2381293.1 hypothetical protein C9374_006282 [Naegleria lovaniensis]